MKDCSSQDDAIWYKGKGKGRAPEFFNSSILDGEHFLLLVERDSGLVSSLFLMFYLPYSLHHKGFGHTQ